MFFLLFAGNEGWQLSVVDSQDIDLMHPERNSLERLHQSNVAGDKAKKAFIIQNTQCWQHQRSNTKISCCSSSNVLSLLRVHYSGGRRTACLSENICHSDGSELEPRRTHVCARKTQGYDTRHARAQRESEGFLPPENGRRKRGVPRSCGPLKSET